MPINTIITRIQYSIFIPFYVKVTDVKTAILDDGRLLEPVDAMRHFRPEPFGVLDRSLVEVFVLRRRDMGVLRDLGRRLEDLITQAACFRLWEHTRGLSDRTSTPGSLNAFSDH